MTTTNSESMATSTGRRRRRGGVPPPRHLDGDPWYPDRRRADDRLDGLARGVRARVLAGRPRPGRSGTPPVRPRPDDLGGLPGLRGHCDRVGDGAVPASIEPARLGPRRRRQRRVRHGVRRRDARRRVALGPTDVGRVLAVGRPSDHHRAAVRHLHRLPRRPPPRGHASAAGQAQRGDRTRSRCSRSRSCTGAFVCGAACTRRRRC